MEWMWSSVGEKHTIMSLYAVSQVVMDWGCCQIMGICGNLHEYAADKRQVAALSIIPCKCSNFITSPLVHRWADYYAVSTMTVDCHLWIDQTNNATSVKRKKKKKKEKKFIHMLTIQTQETNAGFICKHLHISGIYTVIKMSNQILLAVGCQRCCMNTIWMWEKHMPKEDITKHINSSDGSHYSCFMTTL